MKHSKTKDAGLDAQMTIQATRGHGLQRVWLQVDRAQPDSAFLWLRQVLPMLRVLDELSRKARP